MPARTLGSLSLLTLTVLLAAVSFAQPYPRIVGDLFLGGHADLDIPGTGDENSVGVGVGAGLQAEYALSPCLTMLFSYDGSDFGQRSVGEYTDLSGNIVQVRPNEDIRVDRDAYSVLAGGRFYTSSTSGLQPFVGLRAGIERTGVRFNEFDPGTGNLDRALLEDNKLGLAVLPEAGVRFRSGIGGFDGVMGYQPLGDAQRFTVRLGFFLAPRTWGRRVSDAQRPPGDGLVPGYRLRWRGSGDDADEG